MNLLLYAIALLLGAATPVFGGGPAVYGACYGACMGTCSVPAMSAAAAVTAGVGAGPAFGACAASCAAMCASALFCFGPNTSIYTRSSASDPWQLVPIGEFSAGATVPSLDGSNTTVVHNILSAGMFPSATLHTPLDTLTVTDTHRLPVSSTPNGPLRLVEARDIVSGSYVITMRPAPNDARRLESRREMVTDVTFGHMTSKYALGTRDGTIAAANFGASTICDNAFPHKKMPLFSEAMEEWRHNHTNLNL